MFKLTKRYSVQCRVHGVFKVRKNYICIKLGQVEDVLRYATLGQRNDKGISMLLLAKNESRDGRQKDDQTKTNIYEKYS